MFTRHYSVSLLSCLELGRDEAETCIIKCFWREEIVLLLRFLEHDKIRCRLLTIVRVLPSTGLRDHGIDRLARDLGRQCLRRLCNL